MESKQQLTVDSLCSQARDFAQRESSHSEPLLFGITDGKAVGTYLELKFREYLHERFDFAEGNAAKGIDFPELNIDLKVTSIRQPQSSCPFRDAREKVFGLGYSLLVFVYEKRDDPRQQAATLDMQHVVFVEKELTGDFQLTRQLLKVLENGGNRDDVMAVLFDRNLPVDEIGAGRIADEVLKSPPLQGFLTISNAMQWRLQYGRVLAEAGRVGGITRVL